MKSSLHGEIEMLAPVSQITWNLFSEFIILYVLDGEENIARFTNCEPSLNDFIHGSTVYEHSFSSVVSPSEAPIGP